MGVEQARETHGKDEDVGAARRASVPGPDSAETLRGKPAELSTGGVLGLQRSAGNRAVSGAFAVQRHAEGAELPTKDEDAAEVQDAKKAEAPTESPAPPTGETPPPEVEGSTNASTATPPTPEPEPAPEPTTDSAAPSSATRSKADEKKEKKEGKKAGKTFKKAQKLTPGAMSLAGAQSILQGAYGGVKAIVTGTIVILADQPACSAKYDEVQIRRGVKRPDGSDWKMGDCAKDDAAEGVLTQGFADTDTGTIYVNGKTTLVTATAHEMLHTNTVAGFRGKVGETFNEGATEYLARKALKASGVSVPSVTAYPEQVKLTEKLIDFVGEDNLIAGYFSNPDTLVNAFTAKSASTWEALKTAAEALDEGKVKKALKKKKKRK